MLKKVMALTLGLLLITGVMIGCQTKGKTNESFQNKASTETLSTTNDKKTNDFTLKDTLINGKPILQANYKDIISNLGDPKEIKHYKVTPPACSEPQYFAVAVYDDIEIDFDLGFDNKKIEDSNALRYVITGSKYSINGVKVGDNIADLKEMKFKSLPKNADNQDANIYIVLHQLRPDNYFSEYSEGTYMGGIITEDEIKSYNWNMSTCMGCVLLVKDGKINKIVLGYPTAA
ncbi:hypothetical protein [Clostridium thermarum]|uniref:hypothetical protein n=1 Tax=Clostridium thermarum TaxID=1716543 RepID=UPI00111D2968|nr:hypothetical protein [Clostridium thermarum]